MQNNPANACCNQQFPWIPFLTSSPVPGFPLFGGSLIPYKTRPAPVPLTPRFPHSKEKRCEIHHHHQTHQEMADILQKEKKNKPPHHQIRVGHIHAYSQSSTLTLSAPPRRAGTQQTLNPELPTARDNKGEREETAPPVICWFLSPGSNVTWEDAVGTLGRQSLRGSRDACIWMNHAHTLCPLPEGLTWMTRGCNTSQNQQRPPQKKITYRDTPCSTLQTSQQQKTLSEGNFLLMCFSSSA